MFLMMHSCLGYMYGVPGGHLAGSTRACQLMQDLADHLHGRWPPQVLACLAPLPS